MLEHSYFPEIVANSLIVWNNGLQWAYLYRISILVGEILFMAKNIIVSFYCPEIPSDLIISRPWWVKVVKAVTGNGQVIFSTKTGIY